MIKGKIYIDPTSLGQLKIGDLPFNKDTNLLGDTINNQKQLDYYNSTPNWYKVLGVDDQTHKIIYEY